MTDSSTMLRFDPGQFRRQLAASDMTRRYLLALFILSYITTLLPGFGTSVIPYAVMFGSIFGWLIATWVSARTAHYVQRVTQLTTADADADQTELALHAALNRFTLYRTVRILVYHQFAVLRHRQGHFEESSAICSALLAISDSGLARSLRSALLIMFTEDRLQLRDLNGTWSGLAQLHPQELSLVERLQGLLLLIRYEAACGYDDRLLWNLPDRMALIELMPHGAAALCHHLLADAASRKGRAALADWLRRRAELLGLEEAPETTVMTDPTATPV